MVDRREGEFKFDGDSIDEGENNSDEGENIADVNDWTGEGKAAEGCEPGLKDEATGESAWMDAGDKSSGGLIVGDVLGLFGIFSSNSLRRSAFTEQSPILRETSSPCGSTTPSFGLNFADTRRFIDPGNRRKGTFCDSVILSLTIRDRDTRKTIPCSDKVGIVPVILPMLSDKVAVPRVSPHALSNDRWKLSAKRFFHNAMLSDFRLWERLGVGFTSSGPTVCSSCVRARAVCKLIS